MAEQHPFKWRHFQSEIILLCVRWYLRYPLSYRQLGVTTFYLAIFLLSNK
ncbi:MAG: hypothetical protein NVSMB38_45600 [Ktedonobacteraceae bacterium]